MSLWDETLPKAVRKQLNKSFRDYVGRYAACNGRVDDAEYMGRISLVVVNRVSGLLRYQGLRDALLDGKLGCDELFYSTECDLLPGEWKSEMAWKETVAKDGADLMSSNQYMKCRRCGGPCDVMYVQTASSDEGMRAIVRCLKGCTK